LRNKASRRFLASVVLAAFFVVGAGLAVACGSSSSVSSFDSTSEDASHDAGVQYVDPLDASALDSAPPPPPLDPTCGSYCDQVMDSCKGDLAQYNTRNDCIAFCAHLDLGDGGEQKGPSVACRSYYATSPSHTDPSTYCLAAGPFGGGTCGDRCTAFCQVALSACSPDAAAGGNVPFASFPDCRSACEGFAFKDAGADGGGEGPQAAPTPGDTLNCREFQLRKVAVDGVGCADLGPDSGVCH
jgi:hypothetical protein